MSIVFRGALWRGRYHVAVFAVGVVIFVASLIDASADGMTSEFTLALLLGVPLIAIIARFPLVLDSPSGGIEVGFDSSVLIFLICIVDHGYALATWSLGVFLTQLLARKSLSAKAFNVGLGILSGGLATAVYTGITGDRIGTTRELLAVMLAAAAYFIADYVLSAISVAIGTGSSLRAELFRRDTFVAIACFVPFDTLGYLGAIVARVPPWWTVTLLAVPVATLLIAARAMTRGRENARRLTVLFGAAVRAQSLADEPAVIDALLDDARHLLMRGDIRLADTPPGAGVIAVPVQLRHEVRWLLAPAQQRARATVAADEQALRALAAVAADAVARLELTDEMVHVARHDPLTDLPNRGILLDRLSHALDRPGRDQVVLLFIDLDGFKPINDRYGHAVGDEVLVRLAARLRRCVRPSDTVARLGGDEFAVLLEGLDVDLVPRMCDRILSTVERPLVVDGHWLRIAASVGVAHGAAGQSASTVLGNADIAMYEAKTGGKGNYLVYEPGLGEARLERLELVDDLRSAIQAAGIELAYQPIVRVESRRITAVEVLARWTRTGSPVPPGVFISLAEETGLIVPLGDLILAKVAADAPSLRESANGEPLTVSVNVSAAQLRAPEFVSTVARTVQALHGMSLTLEITERQGVDLEEVILEAMHTIIDMGVDFAIDDFGVGFSSISYLRDLPAQVLKVDAALTQAIDRDLRARALLHSIVMMARSLDFRVVAEGIERETQFTVLDEDAPTIGAQGYLLHRPMPLSALITVLREERLPAGRADNGR